MSERVRRNGLLSLVVFIALIALGGALMVTEEIPPHALVAVRGEFYYPGVPTIILERIPNLQAHEVAKMTVAGARALGLQPDAVCLQRGDFRGIETNVLRVWLAFLGVERPSRWDSAGKWRW